MGCLGIKFAIAAVDSVTVKTGLVQSWGNYILENDDDLRKQKRYNFSDQTETESPVIKLSQNKLYHRVRFCFPKPVPCPRCYIVYG
jgi:hypothetical protein